MQKFEYLGLVFRPIRKLSGDEADFFKVARRISRVPSLEKKYEGEYSYKGFYDAAFSVLAQEYDLFECEGKTVIPCEKFLYSYK